MIAEPPRCALRSLALAEDMAGTASTVTSFLLLEHGGPWGVQALRDAPLPDDLGPRLLEVCAATGIRPLLIRRHRAKPGLPPRPRLVLAASRADGGTAAARLLGDVREILDLPLAELTGMLRAGHVPAGWEPVERLFLTCTHGRHDTCCAERGRPVASALHTLAGDAAWEVSHIGGDRFAANVLVLPDGLYYGRVTPGRAADLVAAHGAGRLVLDLLRGRTAYPFPVQAAEIALRRHLAVDDAHAVRLLLAAREPRGAAVRTTTTWEVVGTGRVDGAWRVVVDTAHPGPTRRLTCSAETESAPPVHTIVEVTGVDAPGRGAAGWDRAHAERILGEPDDTVVEALRGLAPGRALDVGTGTGRHALWLASKGWSVTGVDFSAVGLDAGRRAASEAGLDVDWQLGDARVWTPPAGSKGYDLVLVAFVQLPEVLRRVHDWLAPGGRLVVVGHALRNLSEGTGGPRDPRLLHTPESLAQNATDLTVERLEEVVRSTADGPAVDAVLVARRE